MRRSFSLAGSVEGEEEGADEEEVEVEVVFGVVEAAAFAVTGAALGFLGPRAVFDAAVAAAAAAGTTASPDPLSAPAPAPSADAEDEEQEGEETEVNCRRAIKAFASGDGDDAIEASQRPNPPEFAAPLAPWSKLLLYSIGEPI